LNLDATWAFSLILVGALSLAIALLSAFAADQDWWQRDERNGEK
jgi:hypothetical protein